MTEDREVNERRYALLDLDTEKRLHVGIVVDALTDGESASRMLLSVLQAADHPRTRVSVFSLGQVSTALASRIRQAAQNVHLLVSLDSASAWTAAQRIIEADVHVLLYPFGPLPPSHRQLPYHRPAPVQVAWTAGWRVPLGAGAGLWHLCAADLCTASSLGPMYKPGALRVALVPEAIASPVGTPYRPDWPADAIAPPVLSPRDGFQLFHDLGLPLYFDDDEDEAEEDDDGDGVVVQEVVVRRPPPRRPSAKPVRDVVFCSAIPWGQVGQRTLSLWLDLLARSPRARLMTPQLSHSRASAKAARGIAESMGLKARLHFWRRLPYQPLERIAHVCNVVLEPLNEGSVLAQEAMAIGIPVLAMEGDNLAARRTAAALRAAGLAKHVVHSERAYVEQAEAWAERPEEYGRALARAAQAARALRAAGQADILFKVLSALWEERDSPYTGPLDLRQRAAYTPQRRPPTLASRDEVHDLDEEDDGDDSDDDGLDMGGGGGGGGGDSRADAALHMLNTLRTMRMRLDGAEAGVERKDSSAADTVAEKDEGGCDAADAEDGASCSGTGGIYVIEPVAFH